MKRLNASTNQPFRRGDTRSDGYVFFAYTNKKKSSGYFIEIWLKPESSVKATVNDRQRKRLKALGNRSHHASANA